MSRTGALLNGEVIAVNSWQTHEDKRPATRNHTNNDDVAISPHTHTGRSRPYAEAGTSVDNWPVTAK